MWRKSGRFAERMGRTHGEEVGYGGELHASSRSIAGPHHECRWNGERENQSDMELDFRRGCCG